MNFAAPSMSTSTVLSGGCNTFVSPVVTVQSFIPFVLVLVIHSLALGSKFLPGLVDQP